MVLTREPNSKNTLGYDACSLTIPNDNNSIFTPESTGANLRLQASGDRYFMFFNVFSIESIPFETKENVVVATEELAPIEIVEKKEVTLKTKEQKTPKKEIVIKKIEQPIAQVAVPIQQKQAPKIKEQIITPNSLTTISYEKMEGVKKGYYIVANVFSKPNNAINFKAKLIIENIGTPQIFRNPINNFDYVYIERFDNEQDALAAYQNYKNVVYTGPLWIKAINIQ